MDINKEIKQAIKWAIERNDHFLNYLIPKLAEEFLNEPLKPEEAETLINKSAELMKLSFPKIFKGTTIKSIEKAGRTFWDKMHKALMIASLGGTVGLVGASIFSAIQGAIKRRQAFKKLKDFDSSLDPNDPKVKQAFDILVSIAPHLAEKPALAAPIVRRIIDWHGQIDVSALLAWADASQRFARERIERTPYAPMITDVHKLITDTAKTIEGELRRQEHGAEIG